MQAPGAPGIAPRWTSSDKVGVGTALSPLSRVWFTLSHGILNECYYPRVDQACTRDFGLLVTDGLPGGLFAEEKRDTDSRVAAEDDGVPAFTLRNTHRPPPGQAPRFRVHKRVVSDPRRDVVLQHVRLEVLNGGPLRLFALLAPHLVNGGAHNTGWLSEYKGVPMLFAEGDGTALALGVSTGWAARSVGFAGVSDGWQELARHGSLADAWDRAEDGNVALCGEVALENDEAVLALGFGRSPPEAAFRVRASLQAGFGAAAAEYAAAWRAWQAGLRPLDRPQDGRNLYRVSTAVMRAHETPSFPGGLIASLSIPWGASKGDDDLGGYHLVWPRDLVQTAGGMLAAGARDEALRVIEYLRATQEADGRWPQNTWLDGTPYWTGVQMDECAFPVLLVDLAAREGALDGAALDALWPMVRDACGFVLRNGPATAQDRWEENAGFSPFTLAVEVAALLAAADLADRVGQGRAAAFLRDTADAWNASIEEWTWAAGTRLAHEAGVDGHYVRIAPAVPGRARADLGAPVPVRNHRDGEGQVAARDLVSPDALALVRFGLRAPDDRRIVDTLWVVDRALKVELPAGPCWRRYNGDGYGEHPDGSPFDGAGVGRLWPLLTGERAHLSVAAGDLSEAVRLLETLEACTSRGGMIPEQVWDAAAIPARELFPGRPSGSAMPLVWAHAEHVKLLRSIADGRVFDTPPRTLARYAGGDRPPRVQPWRPGFRAERLPAGRVLRIELARPGAVRWSADNWRTAADVPTAETGLAGVHAAELPTAGLPVGGRVVFTWHDPDWAGEDVALPVTAPG